MSAITTQLEFLIELGFRARTDGEFRSWLSRTKPFISQVFPPDVSADFRNLLDEQAHSDWEGTRDALMGMLEGLLAKTADENAMFIAADVQARTKSSTTIRQSNKIFVVHGHDNEVKETVARFLERLGLKPIILHEQPNAGRTIIEKFEDHSDVGFAVVLLTPDDIGGPRTNDPENGNVQPRARQNVVLELGYFLAKLNRNRVCALYKSGVEIPSDYLGVLYVVFDSHGAWRTKLAQELSNAGLSINLEALLQS